MVSFIVNSIVFVSVVYSFKLILYSLALVDIVPNLILKNSEYNLYDKEQFCPVINDKFIQIDIKYNFRIFRFLWGDLTYNKHYIYQEYESGNYDIKYFSILGHVFKKEEIIKLKKYNYEWILVYKILNINNIKNNKLKNDYTQHTRKRRINEIINQ